MNAGTSKLKVDHPMLYFDPVPSNPRRPTILILALATQVLAL